MRFVCFHFSPLHCTDVSPVRQRAPPPRIDVLVCVVNSELYTIAHTPKITTRRLSFHHATWQDPLACARIHVVLMTPAERSIHDSIKGPPRTLRVGPFLIGLQPIASKVVKPEP